MSAKHQGLSFPLGMLLAFAGGMLLAVGAAAALAMLMVSQRLVHPVVWPFATVAVCSGSLFGGYLLARGQKSNGLACGAIQGALFAALLLAVEILNGNIPDAAQIARLLLVLLCGCAGGYLGLLRAEKVRRKH